ncbi:sulfoxide reductase heme-binding subunit YedZ [Paracoccus alcaliphilus]|uniref:Protein-methionine-sulfoxide reductase heme-binding subunit MsrQ n=1 Tax=Paracoccus alcaliphilus TaxID=34002 RepID=A0A1H8GV31_9RHOB|nr:protein-methionine-sulfoxide reductase heme-binding subunit MsrQ [Paracoccus alcaliphilus]WCR18763.1 sulfoxide reductase heme-binding subunit YedZ [Paracoccus alcaliphilus]SEN47128.1 sulfoxide reductase heme-binding subunit YedZ [Paracoccus alcaliphilus]
MAAWLNRWLRRIPVWLVWLLGLIPLALLIADTLTGGLGVEPVRDIEHRLGRTALYFLVASLAVTPLLRLTRVNLIRYRRALGLLCFTYAVLHLLAWVSMDMAFLWAQMSRDLIKRPYLFFGMAGFAILLALAVTSNNRAIRYMGMGWRRLHQLIYVAAPLVVLHWIWALKTFPVIPAIWMGVILGLLLVRLATRRPVMKKANERIV